MNTQYGGINTLSQGMKSSERVMNKETDGGVICRGNVFLASVLVKTQQAF